MLEFLPFIIFGSSFFVYKVFGLGFAESLAIGLLVGFVVGAVFSELENR